MNETQVLEGFWASIGHAPWPVVFGYAIVAICIGVKGMTEGKAHGKPKAWLGAVTGMLIGVGSSMALEGDWVHAIVFGVLVAGSSTGFWSMVKSTIPEFGKPSNMPPPPTVVLTGLLLLVALSSGACGARQAQVAVQTSLTGLAEGVRAGDGALVAIIPDRRDEAIADARARCAVTACPDALALYSEAMAPIDRAVDGLEVAAEGLRLAQVAMNAWVASDELPDAGPLCSALGDAVEPLAGLLDEAGVDVPAGIAGAGGVVSIICGVVARWATPSTEEVSRGE